MPSAITTVESLSADELVERLDGRVLSAEEIERLLCIEANRLRAKRLKRRSTNDELRAEVGQAHAIALLRSQSAALEKLRGADPNSAELWWVEADPESGFIDAAEAYEAATDWTGHRDVVRLQRGRSLPDVWAARVVLTRDDDGEPDETEVRCFTTEEAARQALQEDRT